MLILTANRHFALRRGAAQHSLWPRSPAGFGWAAGSTVGRNRWYLFAAGASRGVFKVRHGRIEEIGIATAGLTRTRAADRIFLRSFF